MGPARAYRSGRRPALKPIRRHRHPHARGRGWRAESDRGDAAGRQIVPAPNRRENENARRRGDNKHAQAEGPSTAKAVAGRLAALVLVGLAVSGAVGFAAGSRAAGSGVKLQALSDPSNDTCHKYYGFNVCFRVGGGVAGYDLRSLAETAGRGVAADDPRRGRGGDATLPAEFDRARFERLQVRQHAERDRGVRSRRGPLMNRGDAAAATRTFL